MSVTIDKEIQKAEVLAAGLRKHLEEVVKHGVTEEGIKKMEELMQKVKKKLILLQQRKEIYENNALRERCSN